MKRFIYTLLASIVICISCAKNSDTVKFTIASEQADCMGVAPQKCMLIKIGDAKDWTYFYSAIEGFTYEPGYEYVLEVKEEKVANAPADASSIKYILKKVVSKTPKKSDNLPKPSAQ
ncbi:MAG: DUF4377 domain-containing protein [Marinifilaceae bacterium]